MFYSKATGGFYAADIHGDNIPSDAIEITNEVHAALLDAQSQGKRIQSDLEGRPIAVDHVPTDDELTATARQRRDSLVSATAWRYERHSRELRLGLKPTDDLTALDTYMQSLADLTKQAGFPESITWPVAP
jgi:hypothetical protein